MSELSPRLRIARRLGVVAAAGVLPVATALVVAAPEASAAGVTVVDCSMTNLQTAIDNAGSGARLVVTGTCSGNYTIGQNLTLLGQGNAVLDGQDTNTTLTVSSGATVGLADLTITDGNASGGAGEGGGINNSGTLTLKDSSVGGNSAVNYGAGIYNSSSLTVENTTISGNGGSVLGGGIYNDGAMALKDTTVTDNSAQAGGGILTGFGFSPVTLDNVTVIDNTATAGSGGGIYNILDSETLRDTLISGNTATDGGGGINNNAGTTTVYDSAVIGNTGSTGGGIYTFSGIVLLTDSIVIANTPDNCDPPGAVTGCAG